MSGPSFQFYPGDWQRNAKLRRCTHAERGIWVDVLCLMHDSDRYGVLDWPLKDIAQAVGCKVLQLQSLVTKLVMKGGETGEVDAFVFVPRHAGKDGDPVILLPAQPAPLWYSSRMVRDEYIRTKRGESTRFGGEPNDTPKPKPKPPIGDGSASASASASALQKQNPLSESSIPDCPQGEILELYAKALPMLTQPVVWEGARADAMRSRWRQCAKANGISKGYATKREGLAFWEKFFGFVAECPTLTNGILRKEGGLWTPDLPWLLKAENFAKVVEGKYHR